MHMSTIDQIISFISIFIVVLIFTMSYKCIDDNKVNLFSLKNILIILLFSILLYFNTYYNKIINIAIISFLIFFLTVLLICKDEKMQSFIKTLICYFITVIVEIVLAIFIIITPLDFNSFNSNIIFKAIFSVITFSTSYFICKTKLIKKLSAKAISISEKHKTIIVLLMISVLMVIVITTKYSVNLSAKTYLSNIILLIGFILLLCITVYNNEIARKEMEKTENLLNFMSKYEKMIDDDRVNRHEMLNNLLILKSIDNKNSKEYIDILNELISLYDKKSTTTIKNIYKLPSGLKGIIYYKIKDMEKNNINIHLNISNEVSNLLEKLNYKEYVRLCKVIGIVIDNAFEAAKESKDKIVNIDICKEHSVSKIIVTNTFKKHVNLEKIKSRYYSTKGRNRGIGLFVANKVVSESSKITMTQKIDKKLFITEVDIK